jgi:two-component system chemotaxis sensor kinase CheA
VDRTELAARLLATFLDELDEQLRTLDEDLLALERDPGDTEHLRSVFRVAHTLKGAARAAGVRPIEEVCHALEAMCAEARDASTPLVGSQVALLFAGSDALADAGRRLRAGSDAGSSPVVAELLHQLRHRANTEDHGERRRPTPIISIQPSAEPVVEESPVAAEPLPAAQPPAAPPDDIAPAAPIATANTRDDQLRVGARQLDSLVAAAGELLGMTGTICDRPAAAEAVVEAVRSWRIDWRRASGEYRRSLDRSDASAAVVATLTSVDDHLARLDRQVGELARALGDDARALGGTTSRLVENVRRLRMRPFADIAEALPRAARDVAASLHKDVQVTVEGQDVEADRTVLDALREPLLHLVRNAVDHGLESTAERTSKGKPAEGRIVIRAELGGDRLRVAVTDDGAGLDIASIRRALAERGRDVPAEDHEVARSLFDSGFSTRRVATAISGRGVGLDIVRTAVERLGGTVEVHWTPGAGTTFTIEAPVSVATMRALTVMAGGQMFAVPTAFLERLMRVRQEDVRSVEGRSVLALSTGLIPLTSLAHLLGPPLTDPAPGAVMNVIVLAAAGRRLAVVVDEMVEERDIVVRPVEHAGDDAGAHFSGAALLDGTRVALVVNAAALVGTAGRGDGRAPSIGLSADARAPAREWHVLVVDDSITTRTLEQSVLAAAGYRVTTAVDGAEAWRLIQDGGIDLVVSDVEMPRMDGLALTEAIRGSPGHATVPVILVTSLDKPEQRARGLEAGADAYIMKSSFDQDTLLGIVRQLLGDAT